MQEPNDDTTTLEQKGGVAALHNTLQNSDVSMKSPDVVASHKAEDGSIALPDKLVVTSAFVSTTEELEKKKYEELLHINKEKCERKGRFLVWPAAIPKIDAAAAAATTKTTTDD